MDVGASEIAIEGFAARETYTRVVGDALRRYKTDRPIRVTSWPPRGSARSGGAAQARSAALRQALEVGTCRIAGHLPRSNRLLTSGGPQRGIWSLVAGNHLQGQAVPRASSPTTV
ncbi:hypothetical protein AB0H42_24235 [Nocardia sp. NPDC050799]|uniref:hypothetical protein n=1 Tax=Nocardia sp. NPDC050799 TaxID=3154842 RepID=UPI003407F02A